MAKKIIWSDQARAEVRAIDRSTVLGYSKGWLDLRSLRPAT
jgi:hypothetical protein